VQLHRQKLIGKKGKGETHRHRGEQSHDPDSQSDLSIVLIHDANLNQPNALASKSTSLTTFLPIS
jgi:hypothetical protein